MTEAMDGARTWREWSAYDWSDAMLDHFFRRQHPNDPPVRVIVTLDDEFADIAQDQESAPLEIVRSLVAKTNRSVGDSGYWRKAQSKRRYNGRPAYLPYLVVGCIAAADADANDEDSFLERFDALTDGKGTTGISVMADLWRDLADWLQDNSGEYRLLELPDPRGWTRIGHTVRLAFPSRRDQLKLHDVLESSNLIVDSPPLGPTLSAVRANRSQFGIRFLEEFEQFEVEFSTGHSPAALHESPFWGAVVRSATIRPGLDLQSSRHSWSFVADDDGYDFELRLVSTTDDLPSGLDISIESASEDHRWPFEASTAVSASLLTAARPGLGRLDALMVGGVIPFSESVDGVLEIAEKQDLTVAPTALVRDDLLTAFVRRFGGRVGEFELDGWSVVRDTNLRTTDTSVLADTQFATTWILHSAPFPRTIRPIGGIRVDRGFYGRRTMVPKFRAHGATAVLVEIGAAAWEMAGDDGIYSVPADALDADLVGDIEITADFPDGTRSQTFTFHAAPVAERFRMPNDLRHLVVEDLCGGSHLPTEPSTREVPPLISRADENEYLGRDVGVFVHTEREAGWKVTSFGSESVARALADDVEPRAVNADKGSARRWRKLLGTATFDDDSSRAAANAAILFTDAQTPLPSVVPIRQSQARSSVHHRLEEVVEILVARANNRSGFSISRFLELLDTHLGVDNDGRWDVLRSWTESGIVEDCITTRFRARKLYAVQPVLDVFETESFVGARLRGLSLAQTREHLAMAAERLGILTCTQGSVGGTTPPTVVFRATECDQFAELSATTGLCWAPAALLDAETGASDGLPAAPITHSPRYQPRARDPLSGSYIQQWTNTRSPTYWQAVAGDQSRWFFHRNNAEFSSASLHRSTALRQVDQQILAVNANLPLPLARRLNLVAPLQSGPAPDRSYRYYCPTIEMADELMAQVDAVARDIVTQI